MKAWGCGRPFPRYSGQERSVGAGKKHGRLESTCRVTHLAMDVLRCHSWGRLPARRVGSQPRARRAAGAACPQPHGQCSWARYRLSCGTAEGSRCRCADPREVLASTSKTLLRIRGVLTRIVWFHCSGCWKMWSWIKRVEFTVRLERWATRGSHNSGN